MPRPSAQPCPFCGAMHLRSSLAIHMRTCEEKSAVTKYECKHCRQYFSLSYLNLHTVKCPLRPLRDDDEYSAYGAHGWKSTVNHNNAAVPTYRPLSPVRYTSGGLPSSSPLSFASSRASPFSVSMEDDSLSTSNPPYFTPISPNADINPSNLALSSSSSSSVPVSGSSSSGLVACRLCSRKFAAHRLYTHESACRKAHRSRPIFDTQSQRMNTIMDQLGTSINDYPVSSHNKRAGTKNRRPYSSPVSVFSRPSSSSPSASPSRAKTSWRQQHNELISAIREAKHYLRNKNDPSFVSSSYPRSVVSPPSEPKIDNRIPCPYCDRSFAYDTAEKHIPICAKTINRPKPPSAVSPSRSRGYGTTYSTGHNGNSNRPSTVGAIRNSTLSTSFSLSSSSFRSSTNTSMYASYGNQGTEDYQRPGGGSPNRNSSVTKSSVALLPSLNTTTPSSSSSSLIPSKYQRPSTASLNSDYRYNRWSPLPTARGGCRDTFLEVDLTRYNNHHPNSFSSNRNSSSPTSIKLGYAMMNTSSSLTNNASSIINSNITSVNNPLAMRTAVNYYYQSMTKMLNRWSRCYGSRRIVRHPSILQRTMTTLTRFSDSFSFYPLYRNERIPLSRASFSTFTSKHMSHLPPGFITDGAYESININMNHYPLLTSTSDTTVSSSLSVDKFIDEIIDYGQTMKKNSMWIHIDLDKSVIPSSSLGEILTTAYRKGFILHHGIRSSIKLYKWLPTHIPNKVPLYATHQIGVAGVVIDNAGRLLLVQERRQVKTPTANSSNPSSPSSASKLTSAILPTVTVHNSSSSKPAVPQWKFPGGLADIGEAFSTTAEREVYEETGLRTKFCSILSFRHQHGMSYGVSDIYLLCLLRPCTDTYRSLLDKDPLTLLPLQIDTNEIADARWMPTEDYLKITTHPLNRYVAELAYHQLLYEQQSKQQTIKEEIKLSDKSIRESDMYIPVTKKQVKVYTSGNSFPLPVSLPPSSSGSSG